MTMVEKVARAIHAVVQTYTPPAVGYSGPGWRSYEREARAAIAAMRVEAMLDVVSAACRVVAADTYKHPMLSREDAVKAGVADLRDAVGRWQAQQPAASQVVAEAARV